jgi:hypothetical protein
MDFKHFLNLKKKKKMWLQFLFAGSLAYIATKFVIPKVAPNFRFPFVDELFNPQRNVINESYNGINSEQDLPKPRPGEDEFEFHQRCIQAKIGNPNDPAYDPLNQPDGTEGIQFNQNKNFYSNVNRNL